MTLTCEEVRDLAPGFVLGALADDEAAAVRAHLASCQALHSEIREFGGTVAYLNELVDPVEPPAALRGRIMEAARAARPVPDLPAAAPTPPALSVVAAGIPIAGPAERSLARATTTPGRILRLAAVIAIVVLGAWNLQLQAHLDAVEGDAAAARAYQADVAAVLDAATRPGAVSGFLAPADKAHGANGIVAAVDGTLLIAMQDLAPTIGAQVYEVWVIVGSADPVPVGDFRVAARGTAFLRSTSDQASRGAIVALTLESGPGATIPTLPIVSSGSVGGGSS